MTLPGDLINLGLQWRRNAKEDKYNSVRELVADVDRTYEWLLQINKDYAPSAVDVDNRLAEASADNVRTIASEILREFDERQQGFDGFRDAALESVNQIRTSVKMTPMSTFGAAGQAADRFVLAVCSYLESPYGEPPIDPKTRYSEWRELLAALNEGASPPIVRTLVKQIRDELEPSWARVHDAYWHFRRQVLASEQA